MHDAVTLSVPDLVEATYVVVTARPGGRQARAPGKRRSACRRPLRVGALRMLAGPLLSVTMSAVGGRAATAGQDGAWACSAPATVPACCTVCAISAALSSAGGQAGFAAAG